MMVSSLNYHVPWYLNQIKYMNHCRKMKMVLFLGDLGNQGLEEVKNLLFISILLLTILSQKKRKSIFEKLDICYKLASSELCTRENQLNFMYGQKTIFFHPFFLKVNYKLMHKSLWILINYCVSFQNNGVGVLNWIHPNLYKGSLLNILTIAELWYLHLMDWNFGHLWQEYTDSVIDFW